jgi:hypothetical protein
MVLILMAGSAMAQVSIGHEDGMVLPETIAMADQAEAASSASTAQAAEDKTARPAAPVLDESKFGPFDKRPCRVQKIQHLRPTSQCGVNIFEPPKEETPEIPFRGLKVDWGVGFQQTFQDLSHKNTATQDIPGVNNKLVVMGAGFNLAGANLYLNAQIADGIRLALTSYLSSRHHNEEWIKDGYILMDRSPFKLGMHGLPELLWSKYVTVKVGHFEINYGDTHFRRTDNGMGIYNPFIGNTLLDPFTTEIGGEVYIRAKGFLAMGSITGGEIKGNVLNPQSRSPAFITKLGFDRQLTPDLRFRITGSNYTIRKSPADTLYAGDRAGSPYFCVLESACTTSEAFSGTINPQFRYRVMAFQVTPFIKYRGLELFGVFEHASGRTAAETKDRTWTQLSGEMVYRFAGDNLYVGGRYNRARGNLPNMINQVSVNRTQFAAGWFPMHYLELKSEYVIQNYKNYPPSSIFNGGRFQGWEFAAVLAF